MSIETQTKQSVRSTRAMLVALAFAFASVPTASAEGIDKSKFKEGCQAGNGSYVESPDGSFQCNTKGGGTVKCADTKSQCTYTEKLTGGRSRSQKILKRNVMSVLPQANSPN